MSIFVEIKEKMNGIDFRNKYQDWWDSVNNALDGKFASDKASLFGKDYEDKKMLSYINSLPEHVKVSEQHWLRAMSNPEIFKVTKDVCPNLLMQVFNNQTEDIQKKGIPVDTSLLMQMPNTIPAMKLMSGAHIQEDLSQTNKKNMLDMEKVKMILGQSPKNFNVLMSNIDRFDNMSEVFEKFPQAIRGMDQSIFTDPDLGEKAREAIKISSEKSEKVKNYAEFYLSFMLDENGNVLTKVSKEKIVTSTIRENFGSNDQKRNNVIDRIKNLNNLKETESEDGSKQAKVFSSRRPKA